MFLRSDDLNTRGRGRGPIPRSTLAGVATQISSEAHFLHPHPTPLFPVSPYPVSCFPCPFVCFGRCWCWFWLWLWFVVVVGFRLFRLLFVLISVGLNHGFDCFCIVFMLVVVLVASALLFQRVFLPFSFLAPFLFLSPSSSLPPSPFRSLSLIALALTGR